MLLWDYRKKTDKAQRFLDGGRVWGAELNDRVSIGDTKMAELIKVTWAVLAHGFITKKSLERLVGHWNFPLQYRRIFFYIFERVYSWMETLVDDRSYRIPPKVIDEFFMLSFLGNLCYTDLGASVSPFIGATDASSSGLGGTEAKVEPSMARKLFCRANIRGQKVKLGAVLEDDSNNV